MINRIVIVLILVPLAVILIALSVANREAISFTIDPFNPGNPALSYSAPLFVWLFASLILGLILGSFATWYNQGNIENSPVSANSKRSYCARKPAKRPPRHRLRQTFLHSIKHTVKDMK